MWNLFIVGLLWGATNPFIKKGASGVERIPEANVIKRSCLEVWYLVTKFDYIVPFLLNQVGSIVFFFALQSNELSAAVPLVNAITFFFTVLTGWGVGEILPSSQTFVGTALILSGITCCVLDKL